MKRYFISLMVVVAILSGSQVFAAAIDRMGTYYGEVRDNKNGLWGKPTFTGNVTDKGQTDIQYVNNSNNKPFPYDPATFNKPGNINRVGTLGFAFYVDWTRENNTAEKLMHSNLMPVYAANFKQFRLDAASCINVVKSAAWKATWQITPPCVLNTGWTKGIWIIEALAPGAVWGGNMLIASNYFSKGTPELVGIYDIFLQSGNCPGPNPPGVVPEPTTMLIFGAGLVGFGTRLRKKK